MSFDTIISILKGLVPVLLPLGEQGINELFDIADKEVAKLSGDLADVAPIMVKALREVALLEFRKLSV